MIADKVYGKLGKTEKTIDYVTIDWFERDKKILRKGQRPVKRSASEQNRL
ncbi:MAG: hypothetical protein ACI4JD_04025 [Ruminococcus sp.]